MDLSEIRAYISSRMAVADLSTDDVLDHINEVTRDLSKAFTPNFIEESTALSTSTSTPIVASTWEMRQLKSVHAYIGGTRTPLKQASKEALVYPLESGTPKFWALWSSTSNKMSFIVNPSSTAAYGLAVQYEPVPSLLSSSSDTPQYISEEHHYLIPWGAMARIASRQEDSYAAEHWENRYRDGINSLTAR